MKNKINTILSAFLIVSLFAFVSCKKDNKDGMSGKSEIVMEMDGKPWKSAVATVITIGGDGSYLTTGTGHENLKGTDGLSMVMLFKESTFSNPKGTYDLDYITNSEVTMSYARNGESFFVKSGKLTIDKFKIDENSFFGESLGKGYTQLSGTFEAILESVSSKDQVVLKAGKFNLKGNISKGNIFGEVKQTGVSF